MIRRPPTSTLFPSTTLFRPRDRLDVRSPAVEHHDRDVGGVAPGRSTAHVAHLLGADSGGLGVLDRKSTRLNSSHANISYAVFCLKKKRLSYFFTESTSRACH